MAGTEREFRLQIMLARHELDAVDKWRFGRQMPSRAAAVRELLRRGLHSEGFLKADRLARSQDFGVVNGAQGEGEAEN